MVATAIRASALGLLPATARAAEPASVDPACFSSHDLWSPLPDRCLGVIDTDRPHQTDTPHTVPAGHTQIESALVAVELGGGVESRRGQAAKLRLFDDAYKFGLASGVDLQLLFDHAAYDLGSRRLLPPGPLSLRAKFSLRAEAGAIPAVTFVPWVFLPIAPTQALRGGPLAFFGWELPFGFELEANAGVLFAARPKPPAAVVLASALTYTVAGEFRIFIDAYATGWDIAFGTGALWAFARDMQLDLGTYLGLSGDEPVATPFLGFSVRR